MSDNNDWNERECGAFWLREGKQKFYSGYVEVDGKKVEIVAFKNKHKAEGDKRPDLRVYLDRPLLEQNDELPV